MPASLDELRRREEELRFLNEHLDQQKEQIVRDAGSALRQQELTLEQLSSPLIAEVDDSVPEHDEDVLHEVEPTQGPATERTCDEDADDAAQCSSDPSREPAAPRWSSSVYAPDVEAVEADGAADTVNCGADTPAPTGMGNEAELRYHQAKLTVANEEIAKLRANLAARNSELADATALIKELQQQCAKLGRAEKAGKAALEREKATAAQQKARVQDLEKELALARQESEQAVRSEKASSSEQRSKDVRLQRALEELEKHRAMLRELREDREGSGQGARAEAQKLLAENTRLKKRQSELLLAFKKQMKLIDVLKRQKQHVEAAQMLSFTEAEFSKTLELGEQMA